MCKYIHYSHSNHELDFTLVVDKLMRNASLIRRKFQFMLRCKSIALLLLNSLQFNALQTANCSTGQLALHCTQCEYASVQDKLYMTLLLNTFRQDVPLTQERPEIRICILHLGSLGRWIENTAHWFITNKKSKQDIAFELHNKSSRLMPFSQRQVLITKIGRASCRERV